MKFESSLNSQKAEQDKNITFGDVEFWFQKFSWLGTRNAFDINASTVWPIFVSDGVIHQYRDYTSKTSNSVYTALSYDTSRIAKIISPPVTSDVDPVTITYDYSYHNDRAIITQTKSSAGEGDDTITQTVLQYFPNTDTSSGQYVVPLAISSVDEAGHSVTSSFDALHRLVSVTDPNGVCISQQWDSLSRLTSRKHPTFKERSQLHQ